MGKSADQIRQEIDRERADAGQKIDELEQRVQDNTEHMKQQARDTAEQVRGEAQALVHDTVHTVKENMNLEEQIQERPLVAAGAALIGGFVLGSLMDSGSGHHQTVHHYSGADVSGSGQHTGGSHTGSSVANGIRSAAKKSGLEETIENAAAALLGSVTEQLKDTLNSRMPGYSEKMSTAEQQHGSFSEKAKATQHEAQQS